MGYPFVSSQVVDHFILFMFATLAYLVPFKRQCQAGQYDEPNSARSTGRVLSKIRPFERYSKFINCLWPYLFGLMFVKHALIALLRLDALKEYRRLDCFLFGRFVFMGRAAVFSETIAFAIIISSSAYRYALSRSDNYQFLLHEFLLEGHEGIEDDDDDDDDDEHGETVKEELLGMWKHVRVGDYLTTTLGRRSSFGGWRKQWNDTTGGGRATCFSEIRNIKLIDREQHGGRDHIVRLNRTPKVWRMFTRSAKLSIYHFSCSIIITIIYIVCCSAPTWFNEQGFKLTHRTCVEYLQQEYLRTNTNQYEYIMDVRAHLEGSQQRRPDRFQFSWNTTRNWDLVFSWSDLCKPSLYHLVRICFTLFDNLLISGEYAMATEFNMLMIMSIIADVVVNTRLIRARLERLLVQMKTRHYYGGRRALVATTRSPSPGNTLATYKDDKCQREIDELQVLLADHFLMIARYNPFVSFYALTMTLVFLVLIVWLNLSFRMFGNPLDQIEYMAFMLFFSAVSISALVILSYVRLINYHLYRLLCSAAVLDTGAAGSKARWLRLLSFYKPNPLYCFRLFKSNEISSLFCLKLTSWIISALLVIESFFYYVH